MPICLLHHFIWFASRINTHTSFLLCIITLFYFTLCIITLFYFTLCIITLICFTLCIITLFVLYAMVLAGSPSCGGDVTVYVCDINQPNLLTPFYSVLVSISVIMALSTVFHFRHSPDNSLFSHSVLPVLSLPCWSFQFQLYVSLRKPPLALMNPWWFLGSKHQLTNKFFLLCIISLFLLHIIHHHPISPLHPAQSPYFL